MDRRQIKGAPYNPRVIDDYAKAKLEKNLRKVGLLQPLVWNRRTGNLVSGHQRLACMDPIEGSDEYALDVAVVDLSEKQEKEQNIFFNNVSAMGEWDADLLKPLLLETNFDLQAAGWDPVELQLMFADDADLAPLFGEAPTEPPPADAPKAPDGPTLQAIKEDRRQMNERLARETDTEFYAVVVFQTREQREAFVLAMGASADDKYLDGARVAFKCGVELP